MPIYGVKDGPRILGTALVIYGGDVPDDVIEYLADRDVSVHCAQSLIQVPDNGNPFSEWMKRSGYKFTNPDTGDFFGIEGT